MPDPYPSFVSQLGNIPISHISESHHHEIRYEKTSLLRVILAVFSTVSMVMACRSHGLMLFLLQDELDLVLAKVVKPNKILIVKALNGGMGEVEYHG